MTPLLLLLALPLAEPPSVYLIGNSLTNDTQPERLDAGPEFHIDCGKSLPYIEENSEQPCKKDSRLWPDALANGRYDVVSMQTHYGSTMAGDVAAISRWIAMQPQARVVLHTGWAKSAQFDEERASTDTSGKMVHSLAWFEELQRQLEAAHPDRTFTRTRCCEALWKIADEAVAGDAPIDSIEELYRDAIHLDLGAGRYLMHNLMRLAVGQQPIAEWERPIEPELKTYLDEQIAYWAVQ